MAAASDLIAQPPSYFNCDCGAGVDVRSGAVSHQHKIKDHTEFRNFSVKKLFCISPEFTDTIDVAADGTKSSFIEIYSKNSFCVPLRAVPKILDENFEEVDTTVTDEYGQLNTLVLNAGFSFFNFVHPTKMPPPGMPYGIYYINFETLYGGEIIGTVVVRYRRPSVAMVHGLWSSGDAFNGMYDYLISTGNYSSNQLFKADYKSTNDAHFSVNSSVIKNAVNQLISSGPSAGKVDLVCHSMGGLLARLHVKNPTHANNKDIRRVITCNTPHAGSQMANWLLDTSQYGTTVAATLGQAGMNCNRGAVSDLRVGQSAIASATYGAVLGGTKVHAIETRESLLPTTIFSNILTVTVFSIFPASMGLLTCGNLFLNEVFNGDFHDFIVAAQSQKGGLSSSYVTVFTGQQHTGSVANSDVMQEVTELLDEPQNSTKFSNAYTGFVLNYNVDVPCLPFRENDRTYTRNMTPDVEITSPVSGTSIDGGVSVNIEYTATQCDSVLCIVRSREDSLMMKANSAAAGMMSFEIPAYMFGQKSFVLIGVDEDKRIMDTDSILLNITTSATLDSIGFYPPSVNLTFGDSTEFSLIGYFSDNVKRDITKDTSLVFEFQTNNAVLANGTHIRLDMFGEDRLVVKKGTTISSDTIEIRPLGTLFTPGCNVVSSTANDGFGSLRQALKCVYELDTIFFSPSIAGDTIILEGSRYFYIDKSVTFINNNALPVYILSGADAVMTVFAESEVEFQNIRFISDSDERLCLLNFGNVTIENCNFLTTGSEKGLVENQGSGVMTFKGNNLIE